MPIHHNKDGTWQWGQAGKKYRSRKDALRQMRAIFANGYKEQQDKKASFQGASRASCFLAAVASVGSYGMVKKAAKKVPNYHRYFDPVQITRGQTISGIWDAQRKKNSLVPDLKTFTADWKAQNKGSDKLYYGNTYNKPRYMPRKVVQPIAYLSYGQDQSKWDAIERENKRRAYFNALQMQQSKRDVNAIGGKNRVAFGLGQLQQNAIDAIKQAVPGWGKNFTAASMLDNVQGSRYAIQKYTDLINRKATKLNLDAINVVDHPQRSYYRYTWGPYAHYNYIKAKRAAGVPQQELKKITEQSLALADTDRVAKFMNYYKNQLNLMPRRPGFRSAPVSTPVTK